MKILEATKLIMNPIYELRERVFNGLSLLRRTAYKAFAIIGLSILIGAANTVAAQRSLRENVQVGKTIEVRIDEHVESFRKPVVADEAIAGASYSENRISITGRSPGTTTVTFYGRTGTIAPGNMGTKPFSYRITVVVLPARADIKPAVNNYRVSQGSSRNTRVGALLLRAVFEKPGQEGNEWRNVEVKSSDDGIATARLYKDPKDNYVLKVEIRGRSQGRATIILTGEARLQNTWQQVIREINVVVTGNQTNDKEPPADDSETDVFLDGIQRRYETLKNTSERIGPDDRKWSLMLQEFEQFIALLDQELEKERRRPNPRRERLSQLAKLRDKASQDLRHLREKQTDPGSETHNDEISSLTGNWRGVFRGEETRGFRIEEINGRVKLWSPTRLLVFEGTRTGMIVEGKSIVRSGETDTGLSLSRQLRVRTGTSGLRLEVWGKRMNEKLQETGDYYPTGIFYIREAR